MSLIPRISSYALQQVTLGNSTRVQAQLADIQQQVSSGYKAQTFAGMAADAQQYLSLQAKLSRSNQYISGNNLVQTRISSADKALSGIIDTTTTLKNLISTQRTATTGSVAAYSQQLEGVWNALTSQLNTNVGGRYLFSGTATQTQAVNTVAFPTLKIDGQPDSGYYQGSTQDITVQPEDNVEMIYNIRADAPGFQQVFAGLAMASKAARTGDDADFKKAYDLASQGLDNIIALQTSNNANKLAIDNINAQHTTLNLYYKGVAEDLASADVVSLSTQVASDQATLTAMFQTFSKINALRLSDYLK